MDSIIVAATLVGSFGAAFAMQKMALGLLLRAMGTPFRAWDWPDQPRAEPSVAERR